MNYNEKLSKKASKYLEDLLKKHKIKFSKKQEWLDIADKKVKLKTAVFEMQGSGRTVQLDIITSVNGIKPVVESFGGIGTDTESALADAMTNFITSSFHVILSSFAIIEESDHGVDIDRYVIDNVSHMVLFGDPVYRGGGNTALYEDTIESLKTILKKQSIPLGVHSFRFFFASHESKIITKECLLYGRQYECMKEEIDRLDLPVSDEFFSVRIFAIVTGGLDISEAVRIILENPDKGDDKIVSMMISAGFSEKNSERFAVYIPMAFGRTVIEQYNAKLSDEINIRYEDGTENNAMLRDDPFFCEAYHIAQDIFFFKTLSNDQYMLIAGRSAEISAFLQGLNSGNKPDDMSFSPTIVNFNIKD